MELDRVLLKSRAKDLIRRSRPSVLACGALYLIIVLVLSNLAARAMSVNVTMDKLRYLQEHMMSGNPDIDYLYALTQSMQPPASAYGIKILLDFCAQLVGIGYTIFLLNTIRRSEPSFGNLLDGFTMLPRFLLLTVLEGLIVGLLSLLLIVPGIVASYRYRMAIYLLIDHPEMGPVQCLRESARIMKGHKLELFVLDLSFIGWVLLTGIPGIGTVLQLWTVPYMNLVFCLYYEYLRGAPVIYGFDGGEADRPSYPF